MPYGNTIDKAKCDHWDEYMENIDKDTIWDSHKYVAKCSNNSANMARIPALKHPTQPGCKAANQTPTLVNDNNTKSKILSNSFFYTPPENLPDYSDYEYPEPG